MQCSEPPYVVSNALESRCSHRSVDDRGCLVPQTTPDAFEAADAGKCGVSNGVTTPYFGNCFQRTPTCLCERLKLMQLQNLARTKPFDQIDLFSFEEPNQELQRTQSIAYRVGGEVSHPQLRNGEQRRHVERKTDAINEHREPLATRKSNHLYPMFAHLLTISLRYSLAQILSQRNFGVNK